MPNSPAANVDHVGGDSLGVSYGDHVWWGIVQLATFFSRGSANMKKNQLDRVHDLHKQASADLRDSLQRLLDYNNGNGHPPTISAAVDRDQEGKQV